MKNLLAKKVKKNNKGFTLVELIIVIAIIAILVAVLAPNYVKYVDRSRWSSDRNDCESLLSEVKTAYVDTQNDGNAITAGTIRVNAGGVHSTLGDTDPLIVAVSAADSSWNKISLKHKNDQSLPGTTDKHHFGAYTISITTDSGVTGKWDEATPVTKKD